MNQCRKKIIPWHVQQRYMESFSQLSLNHTISAAMYKKKINLLQRNNKHLALAYQRNKHLQTEKENLLIDNGKILNIINFSRVKLMDMAINIKQASECLDETLLMLNSSLADSFSKHLPSNSNFRNDFKSKLQEISRNSPIKEVSETSDGLKVNVQSNARKGKISRVDGCVSSPNKKCKLTMKVKPVKRHFKDIQNSSKESSPISPHTNSKNTNVKKSFKKSVSSLDIKSQKNSLPKNSNNQSASSSKLSTSSKCSLQAKTKQESLNKKCKALKVILTDIAEDFLTRETDIYHVPLSNEPTSASHSKNVKFSIPNCSENDNLMQKHVSSELASKQNISASNSCGSQFVTIHDDETPYYLPSTSNSSHLSSSNISEIDEKSPTLSSEKEIVCQQNCTVGKMGQIGVSSNSAKQNNGSYIKKTGTEKDKRSNISQKLTNRLPLYYDEDSIENLEGNAVASKDRIRKAINKCKARKTVSHKKNNISSESTALKSNLILADDSVSKLGKNSFLVTAEVHSPPNSINGQEMKSKIFASEKKEPCVVLTDIFKSNQGLLSEMVSNCFHKNECMEKPITKPAPLTELDTTLVVNKNSDYVNHAGMDCENEENRCSTEDRNVIKQGKLRRRSKIVSYKEPTIKLKMRRLF